MRAEKLAAFLRAAVTNRRRVLIKGRPGIGKSDLVAQVAADISADLVIFHPAVSDPTDYKGLPALCGDGTAHFLPFGDLNKLVKATKLTVAFLDDIGQAVPQTQAALMQLVLARQVNGTRISDQVCFIGATNDTTHGAAVSGMIEPLKSRFDSIVTMDFSVDDWCSWAFSVSMPVEVIAYARQFPDALCPADWKPSKEIKATPCPRTFASVGAWLNQGVDDHEVIAGAIGESEAIKFGAFRLMLANLPSIDDILLNPGTAPLPPQTITVKGLDGADHTYSGAALGVSVATALAGRATDKNFGRIITYTARLEKRLDVLCVRDSIRRNKSVALCPEFTRWAVENQGVL